MFPIIAALMAQLLGRESSEDDGVDIENPKLQMLYLCIAISMALCALTIDLYRRTNNFELRRNAMLNLYTKDDQFDIREILKFNDDFFDQYVCREPLNEKALSFMRLYDKAVDVTECGANILMDIFIEAEQAKIPIILMHLDFPQFKNFEILVDNKLKIRSRSELSLYCYNAIKELRDEE